MASQKFDWPFMVRISLLLAVLCGAAFVLVKGWFTGLVVVLPVVVYQVVEFYRFHRKAHEELDQFVTAIHYRDFSRKFEVTHAPGNLKALRKEFNAINDAFRIISKEKETQYLYLQNIMELVDTGILSYKNETGEVVWMNESLKKMLQLPYLKTIHALAKRDEMLYRQVLALKPAETLIGTARIEKSSFKILMSATGFQTDGEKFTLIAFQDVQEALEETESKAWQKLLSVMTHEIMNSIAPIASLAETLRHRLQEARPGLNNAAGNVDDLELGIDTIKKRSEGLLKFAETYRNFNKVASPRIKKVYVRDLFENLITLMQPTLDQKNIDLEMVLKDMDLTVHADSSLIEQVLINLVVNSIEAVKESQGARIVLSGYRSSGCKVMLKVSDNGTGITSEVMENIFIPFFTTKKSGSGIGLSICKQIMTLHHGSIQVQSAVGEGAAFLLQFDG